MPGMDENMSDEFQDEAAEEPEDDGRLTFQVKRSHIYALAVPLAFILGLAAGYFAWGQPAVANVSTAFLAEATATEAAPEERSLAEEVAEQIPTLQRHEIEIGEQDPAYGPLDAPVTIVEFADYECPFCQRHFQEVYPQLVAAYGDQLRYVFKDLPLTAIHPNAMEAALAAQCANEQDAFWPYHDMLFVGELDLSRSSYEDYAEQLGLDLEQFTACLDEERYLEGIGADVAEATSIGLSSTPTFFINGLALVGAQPFELFEAIIDYELAQAVELGN